jgi:hypothetical protein
VCAQNDFALMIRNSPRCFYVRGGAELSHGAKTNWGSPPVDNVAGEKHILSKLEVL